MYLAFVFHQLADKSRNNLLFDIKAFLARERKREEEGKKEKGREKEKKGIKKNKRKVK